MDRIPNLAGIATANLVEKIGGGNFSASYINWSRTLHLLRENAPGWLPELVYAPDGGIVHSAPVGAFLLIRFRHMDGTVTPEVPQAIMDHKNNAIPLAKVDARHITDTHRRGVCMAAALTFGLAYELWARMPMESGYAAEPEKPAGRPTDGVWEAAESLEGWDRAKIEQIGVTANEYWEQEDVAGAADYMHRLDLPVEVKSAVWTMLDSKFRAALRKHHKENQ